jgi:hypothetical protein
LDRKAQCQEHRVQCKSGAVAFGTRLKKVVKLVELYNNTTFTTLQLSIELNLLISGELFL